MVVTPLAPAKVTGRLVKDGAPVPAGVTVKLEDVTYVIVATVTTDDQGVYTFDGLASLDRGANVLFAQEWNEQYNTDEVVSWAWLGPLSVARGNVLNLPDFDVSMQGFEPVAPSAGASFSAADISAQNPIVFEWSPYPEAIDYWVDLMQGDDLNRVWQSPLVGTTSVAFDGTTAEGSPVTADTYWWGVGARRMVGNYQLTIYGYLPTLTITP